MLNALKKLIVGDERPDVVKMFEKAKDERQALLLLKEARTRDEARRLEAQQKITTILKEEEGLMKEGQKEGVTEAQKMHLVRQIKALREQARDYQNKIDKIYGPRIRTVSQHIASLETVIEVKNEPIPSIETIESTAVKAKTLMGDLDQAVELAHGISVPFMKEGPDAEDQAILDEMKERSEMEKEKKETQKKLKELEKLKIEKKEEVKEVKKASDTKKKVAKKAYVSIKELLKSPYMEEDPEA